MHPIYKYYLGPAVGNFYATEKEGEKIVSELIKRGLVSPQIKPMKQLIEPATLETFFSESE